MIKIKFSTIKKVAFSLITIPAIVFMIGWLEWYWVILGGGVLCICFFLACIKQVDHDELVEISKKAFWLILLISIVWVWLSGIGGFWAQSEDFPYRNAIFRDLILRKWPVIYPISGNALVYYIGFWLVPAVVGKLALLFGANDISAYNVGCVALYVWTVICVFVIFLMIINQLKASNSKKQVLAIFVFIFFSGMDILGRIGVIQASNYHLEWWAKIYQYSSFTTCLFWVYNQAIPAWICFFLLLKEKNPRNYVFIGMMCLFCAPLPFVGLFIYAIVFAIINLVQKFKEKQFKEYIRNIVSVSNALCVVVVFPIVASYLLSNAAIQGKGAFQVTQEASEEIDLVSNYFSFICIEFLFFVIFMFKKYKHNITFYVTVVSLLIIPLLKIGSGYDFSMRASIPGLIMLYLFVVRFLFEERTVLKEKKSLDRLCYILMIIFLVIGSVTPGMEFFRGCRQVSMNGIRTEEEDNIYTLGGDGPYDDSNNLITHVNFLSTDAGGQLFFRVFAKQQR